MSEPSIGEISEVVLKLIRYAQGSRTVITVGANQELTAKLTAARFTVLPFRVEDLVTAREEVAPGDVLLLVARQITADDSQIRLLKAGFGDAILTRNFTLARAKVMPTAHKLSVIVPVYNEAATCTQMLDQLTAKNIAGIEIEIIIVESNSTDGSRKLVSKYASDPRVKLILQDRPRGKGNAVRQGFAAATGTILLIQDADLEYDINDYDALIEPIVRDKANFVLGSRHNQNGPHWKIRKFADSAFLGNFFNFGHLLFLTLFNVLYRQRLTDPFTMFKVFRRECLYGLAFECDRFDFDNELVIKLIRKGYRPLELPVNYASRSLNEGKKISIWRDPPTWVAVMLKCRVSRLYNDL